MCQALYRPLPPGQQVSAVTRCVLYAGWGQHTEGGHSVGCVMQTAFRTCVWRPRVPAAWPSNTASVLAAPRNMPHSNPARAPSRKPATSKRQGVRQPACKVGGLWAPGGPDGHWPRSHGRLQCACSPILKPCCRERSFPSSRPSRYPDCQGYQQVGEEPRQVREATAVASGFGSERQRGLALVSVAQSLFFSAQQAHVIEYLVPRRSLAFELLLIARRALAVAIRAKEVIFAAFLVQLGF